jgi:hypothetical protein
VTAEEFVARAGRWARRGVSAVPVEAQATRPRRGGRGATAASFRVVLGSTQDVADFHAALEADDQGAVAGLLGYPTCCYEAYRRVWIEQGLTDTTWSIAVASSAAADGSRVAEIEGPPQTNVLWRPMGACAVSHPPCRLDCRASVALVDGCIALGREAGYEAEMDWLLEILSWPAEWSALHGIAEIKTPVLKVSTRTDATAHKYVVKRQGTSYPAEGVQGLAFPYRTPAAPLVTGSGGFRRGLENPIESPCGHAPEAASTKIPLPLCVG